MHVHHYACIHVHEHVLSCHFMIFHVCICVGRYRMSACTHKPVDARMSPSMPPLIIKQWGFAYHLLTCSAASWASNCLQHRRAHRRSIKHCELRWFTPIQPGFRGDMAVSIYPILWLVNTGFMVYGWILCSLPTTHDHCGVIGGLRVLGMISGNVLWKDPQ